MDRETWVYIDLDCVPILVGRLWTRVRQGRESASFQYDEGWLHHPARFALEPALTLGDAAHHTPAGKALFRALGDSAPDRWGRALMGRAERRGARAEGRAARTLFEIDFLLRVNDRARQGALRFAECEGGPFVSTTEYDSVPPLVELPRLLAASDNVLGEDDSYELLQLLLAPGSSLGGARPKASVLDAGGNLAIAKFPKQNDDYNVVRWETVALSLAARAGIDTPEWRLENLDGRSVLIIHRFDRDGDQRIPFLSAMSMIGADDLETRSYLEVADALRQHGANAAHDLEALWRRIVFSVLISNTDDHLRNHGFLFSGHDGWRLSPAYDLNPVPIDVKPRFLMTAIDLDDTAASIELALEVAEYFTLDGDQARAIAKDVAEAVADWRTIAATLGISAGEIDRMSTAFEHDDMQVALEL